MCKLGLEVNKNIDKEVVKNKTTIQDQDHVLLQICKITQQSNAKLHIFFICKLTPATYLIGLSF